MRKKYKYAYTAKDHSALSNLVYQPFVKQILETVSPDISPHAFTVTGAVCVAMAWAIMHSRWASKMNDVLISLLLVAYQIFDSLDGMQARRQGTSSPFGEFLDHSCDGLCAVVLYFISIRIFNLTTAQSLLFAPLYWNHFFLAHLEGNLADQFTFQTISGPTDGIFVVASFLLYRAWFGKILSPPYWIQSAKIIFFLGCFLSLPYKLFSTLRAAKKKSYDLTPFVILALLTSIIFVATASIPYAEKSADDFILGYSLNMCCNALQVSFMKLLKHISAGYSTAFPRLFMTSMGIALWLSNIFFLNAAQWAYIYLNAFLFCCLMVVGLILLG